jgi:hypothetical protein
MVETTTAGGGAPSGGRVQSPISAAQSAEEWPATEDAHEHGEGEEWARGDRERGRQRCAEGGNGVE